VTPTVRLHLALEPHADEYLSSDPLALLIGMLLDQQFPMERAFAGPYLLADRLGHRPTAAELAGFDPEALAALFARPPVLHRYPRAMAGRVQALARFLVENYGGDAGRLWAGVSGGEQLLRRLQALPGFGQQKARIFLALLGKQCGVRPDGWRQAAGAYGEDGSRRSIADVTDERSLREVREFKRAVRAASRASG
jgi:uncharacterized HhH-GPD family protein